MFFAGMPPAGAADAVGILREAHDYGVTSKVAGAETALTPGL